jgi:hypothetical protein
MAKWIKFKPLDQEKRITKRWQVLAIQGETELGIVSWYSGWRRYCFFPNPQTLYEQDCLRDIATFCEEETTTHKNGTINESS